MSGGWLLTAVMPLAMTEVRRWGDFIFWGTGDNFEFKRERRPLVNTRPHFWMGTPLATLGPYESYTHDKFVIVWSLVWA